MASLRASQESLNRDYRELQAKKASIREMKGTREQRIKSLRIKQRLTGCGGMMQDPELMKRYGIEMEKMKAAMKMKVNVCLRYTNTRMEQ